jgi:hypothetical protein
MRRILVSLPMIALFLATGVIVLAARAPRTWADHWTASTLVSPGSGQNEYGAVALPRRRWDILWLNSDTSRIVYTHQLQTGSAKTVSYPVDKGDVQQPDITRVGNVEFGVWVHNYNGSTAMYAATFARGRPVRIFRVLAGATSLEHPHPFSGGPGVVNVVFSWQRPNYDLFLARLSLHSGHVLGLKRLTIAQFYSFYPKVTVDGQGHVVTLHLESCCQQKLWDVTLSRFDASGHRLGIPILISQIRDQGDTPQWAEDLRTDPNGNVWGAVGGDSGIIVFRVSSSGKLLVPPTQINDLGGPPDSLALALGRSGGYIFWQQSSLFGGWLAAATLSEQGRIENPERAVYESGTQANPYAAASNNGAEVLWEDVTKDGIASFQMSSYRPHVRPTLAQRLGLGVGDTWQDVGIVAGGAVGLAAISVAANVLTVFLVIAASLLFMRFVRRLRQRWILYAGFLTAMLFVLFVSPGGPLIFLRTLPISGLPTLPYGVLATLAVFGFILWLSSTVLNHIDDVYRVGVMACAGMFFFAFVEAITLVEGQLSFLG